MRFVSKLDYQLENIPGRIGYPLRLLINLGKMNGFIS
jgi:hypothetical protein